jgi:hypothetical protein
VTVTHHNGRTFDFVARLDPGNRPYRLTAADPSLLQKPRYWTPGLCLNQGEEGACVPHGVEGEALASPVRVKPPEPQALAFDGYDWCRRNDPFPGEDYDGTDVNTGMKWGRLMGWWTGWRWAFNMLELRTALEEGPVVIGVDWLSGMYEAPGGVLEARGQVVGGHCILVTGYTPDHKPSRQMRGYPQPAYRLRNSWSADWGINGTAYTRAEDLDRILFQAGGEAAVAVGRKA